MKNLLTEALPFLEDYLKSLIASYAVVQPDGTYRLMPIEHASEEVDRVALIDLANLQLLIPKLKAALSGS